MDNTVSTGGKYIAFTYRPAIILYPALMTPSVITKDEDVEMILLGKDNETINKTNVAHQLKISVGLGPDKACEHSKLRREWIEIVTNNSYKIDNLSWGTISDKFEGIVHKAARRKFKKEGYSRLYKVKISVEVMEYINEEKELENQVFNLCWYYNERCSVKKKSSSMSNNMGVEGDSNAYEVQDNLIRNVIEELNGNKIPKGGRFCFQSDGKMGYPYEINENDPIQSYHPVFYRSSISAPNIGHISDIHLCARQHIMAESPAKVIEGASDDVSPPVGDLVNVNLERFIELLISLGNDPDIDIILVGGDIADYIKSLYPGQTNGEGKSTKEVWDLVELDEDYKSHYQDFVDFISFFSVVIWFYRSYEKPVYIVSGNHDAYYEPYGISPRASSERAKDIADIVMPASALIPDKFVDFTKRLNASIPGDHNMTFYEAILCFGDTFDVPTTDPKDNSPSTGSIMSFRAEKFMWFYMVYTPFSDFAVTVAGQTILGLQWGESEDIIGIGSDKHSSRTHVPRSDGVIKTNQKNLIKSTTKKHDDIILMTHFTFVSYESSEPINRKSRKNAYISYGDEYDATKYDIGTFGKNREFAYQDILLNTQNIKAILTGHTHRRGLYGLEYVRNKGGKKYVDTSISDLTNAEINNNVSKNLPLIIVSDSAGPLPGFNMYGELHGQGRTSPSATKVIINSKSLKVDSVSLVSGTSLNKEKPRFIVSIDYFDVLVEDVIQKFECVFGDYRDNIQEYSFKLELHEHIDHLATVEDIKLYTLIDNKDWTCLEMETSITAAPQEYDLWTVSNPSLFTNTILKDSTSKKHFLAIKFIPNPSWENELSHYSFDSYWCFPAKTDVQKVNYDSDMLSNKCRIKREPIMAEKPDFEWLKNIY